MLSRWPGVLICCLLIINWPISSQADTIFQSVGIASSPNPVGSGARALGMGGAFIAVADDATAASWNPAGLVQLERPEFSIVGDYVNRTEDFNSSSNPEIENDRTTDKTRLNFISFTAPFSIFNRNVVVSGNYQRLYDFERSFNYPRDVSGGVIGRDLNRFDQDGFLGAFGLATAVELTPWLSLGATLNIWSDAFGNRNGWKAEFNGTSTITAVDFPGFGTIPLDPPLEADLRVEDEYDNFSGTNWNIGMLWNIGKYLSLGAVVKTEFWGEADHTFRQVLVDQSTSTTSEILIRENVDIRFPRSYGAGIACRFTDSFTMDLDVYRTDWSGYYIEDSQGNQFSGVDGRPRSESNVNDTTQVRLGAEYLFLMPEKQLAVPLRGGVFYDPEPKQGNPEDYYGIAVGSGLAYKQFLFDVAYQFRWADNVNADRLIDTGNTELDVRQHTVLASMIVHF